MILGLPAGYGVARRYKERSLIIPGIDAANADDWVTIDGGPVATQTSQLIELGPTFVGAPSASSVRSRHVWYNVPSTYQARSDIGALTITLVVTGATYSLDTDAGYFALLFYDGREGSGKCLGVDVGAYITGDTLDVYTLAANAPRGTRSFTFEFRGWRSSGSELSVYWKMVSLTLGVNKATRRGLLYTDAGPYDAYAEENDWLTTTGTLSDSVSGTYTGWPYQNRTVRWGGSQAELEYQKVIDIPDYYQPIVRSVGVTAKLKRQAWRDNASDTSRVYCDFLNSRGSIVATLEDAESPTTWPEDLTGQDVVSSWETRTVAVPDSAVKARIGFHFIRNDGTVSDARVSETEISFEWNDPLEPTLDDDEESLDNTTFTMDSYY